MRAVSLSLIVATALAAATVGCGSASDASSDESDITAGCAESPQFTKIKSLVEPLQGVMGSYAMTTMNSVDDQPLLRGPVIFGKMSELIANAEEEVLFQTWRWDDGGDPANLVLAGIKNLQAKRRAESATKPVVVRLLINSIIATPKDQMEKLGKRIEELKLDPKLVDVRLAEFVAVQLGANHTKTLVVDAKKAVITGTNASSDNGSTPSNYWDAGYLVGGEVARALHNDFAGGWADGELYTCGGKGETPDPRTGEPQGESCRTKPDAMTILPTSVRAEARNGLSCIPIMVAGHKERTPAFPESKYDNAQDQAFIGMFAFAEKRIRIQSPNLNDQMAKNAILSAVRSGIEVDLLLSKKYEQMTESLPGRGGPNSDTVDYLHSLLYEIPVEKRCKLLQIRWFSNDGKNAEEVNGPPSSHVKYMSIDGNIVMVGSANQDVQSWQNSREVNIVIDSRAVTKNFDEKVFEAGWNKGIPVDQCAGQ